MATTLALKVVVDLSKQIKDVDYEVLSNILSYVDRRIRLAQKDSDWKIQYLQKRLEDLGLIKTWNVVCPVCGRLVEEGEPTFGYIHPVCADCIVRRTEDVKNQLAMNHPDLLTCLEEVKQRAQKYLERRSKASIDRSKKKKA